MLVKLEESIRRFKSLPNSRIDRNYGQGRSAVAEQMMKFYMIDNPDRLEIDDFISISKAKLDTLKKMVQPQILPEEYSYFLENYGGGALVNQNEVSIFTLYGIGPGIDTWYGDLVEITESNEKIKYLRIGSWESPSLPTKLEKNLVSPKFQLFNFYIDLVGDYSQNGILTAGPWDYQKPEKEWKLVAPSFVEWLINIVETGSPTV